MRSNNQFVNSGNNRVFSYLRWSSERQTWGDSERRQNEMAEAWCARLGLNLSGCEKDEGVSAFKGKNHGQGTGLDRLLKIVGPGDTILVEDNDRFSRQDTVTALSALRDIVSRGVKLVFLKTGVEVTAANFNDPSVLFPNFFQGYLANAESAKKAARVKASWEARKAAMVKEGKPMNQNLPSWLRWNWETKEVVQIPERVQIVRRIFKLYLDNGSIKKVTRQLVSEGIPSISKRKSAGWSNSFIHHLLTNRSVLGYSLHTNPPTPNIFPKIVAEKDFYAVGGRLKVARNFCAAARKADANLFTGIALCSKCGRPMNKNTYRRKETQRSYLICGAALHDTSNCGTSGIRYDVFENSFLGLLTQDETVRAVLTGKTAEPGKVDSLKAELA